MDFGDVVNSGTQTVEVVGFSLAGRARGLELVQILGDSRCHENLLIKKGSCEEIIWSDTIAGVSLATVEINQSLTSSAPALTVGAFFIVYIFS